MSTSKLEIIQACTPIIFALSSSLVIVGVAGFAIAKSDKPEIKDIALAAIAGGAGLAGAGAGLAQSSPRQSEKAEVELDRRNPS